MLRRILRRAVRHGMRLGFEEPFLHKLVPVLGEVMGGAYPELAATRQASMATVRAEEEKFLSTVANGARQVQEEIERLRREGEHARSPGAMVFRLYDTYGLPLEVIREIAEEERFQRRRGGFSEALEAQREQLAQGDRPRCRTASARCARCCAATPSWPTTRFEGYDRTRADRRRGRGGAARHLAGRRAGARLDAAGRGRRASSSSTRRSFYAESGGEVGDTGDIALGRRAAPGWSTPRRTPAGVIFHFVEVEEGQPRAPHRGAAAGGPRPAAAPSSATTPRPTCCTRRCARCSARACARPARWWRRTACASTSPTTAACSARSWEQIEDLVNEWVPPGGADRDRLAQLPGGDRAPAPWRCSARSTASGCAR